MDFPARAPVPPPAPGPTGTAALPVEHDVALASAPTSGIKHEDGATTDTTVLCASPAQPSAAMQIAEAILSVPANILLPYWVVVRHALRWAQRFPSLKPPTISLW